MGYNAIQGGCNSSLITRHAQVEAIHNMADSCRLVSSLTAGLMDVRGFASVVLALQLTSLEWWWWWW